MFNQVDSERNAIRDKVYAAMETGNHSQARTIITELKDVQLEFANTLWVEVLADYGVSL